MFILIRGSYSSSKCIMNLYIIYSMKTYKFKKNKTTKNRKIKNKTTKNRRKQRNISFIKGGDPDPEKMNDDSIIIYDIHPSSFTLQNLYKKSDLKTYLHELKNEFNISPVIFFRNIQEKKSLSKIFNETDASLLLLQNGWKMEPIHTLKNVFKIGENK